MKDMAEIPGYHFVKMHPITKGLSGDEKFYLETEDGQRFLARICACSEYKRKSTHYQLLQKVSEIGIPMPMPVAFSYCEDKSKIYTLLSWVDGEDAQRVLPKLSQEEQYRFGIKAGRILRKLHDHSPVECKEEILKLNRDIDLWYDGMRNPIPTWYTHSIRAKTEKEDLRRSPHEKEDI